MHQHWVNVVVFRNVLWVTIRETNEEAVSFNILQFQWHKDPLFYVKVSQAYIWTNHVCAIQPVSICECINSRYRRMGNVYCCKRFTKFVVDSCLWIYHNEHLFYKPDWAEYCKTCKIRYMKFSLISDHKWFHYMKFSLIQFFFYIFLL